MIEQNTDEWLKLRLGHITGSQVGDLMGKGRSKDKEFSDTAIKYMYEVAASRSMDDAYKDGFLWEMYKSLMYSGSKVTEWGHDNEGKAAEYFTLATNIQLNESTSVQHPSIEWFAASPDRIGRDEEYNKVIVEIKCPLPKNYMIYRANITDAETLKKTEPKYYWQMCAELSCTQSKYGYFVVFCPFQRDPLHYAKIEPSIDDIHLMEERVQKANEYIERIINGFNVD